MSSDFESRPGPWRGYPNGDGSWTVGYEDTEGIWQEQEVAEDSRTALRRVMELRGIDKKSRRNAREPR